MELLGILLDFPLLLIGLICTPFSLWGFARGSRLLFGENAEKIYVPPSVLLGWIICIIFVGMTFLGLMFFGIILLAISKSKEVLLRQRRDWIDSLQPPDIIHGIETQMLDEEVSDRIKENWYSKSEQSRTEFIESNLGRYKAFLLSTAKISPGAKELVANWTHGLEIVASTNVQPFE